MRVWLAVAAVTLVVICTVSADPRPDPNPDPAPAPVPAPAPDPTAWTCGRLGGRTARVYSKLTTRVQTAVGGGEIELHGLHCPDYTAGMVRIVVVDFDGSEFPDSAKKME
ncbi:hypothetical protein ElyMa_000569000 [Elysia marginata]|uniref:Uncharacterized protein n=1 Tax=Elysia marginata TaxID=1093978 RepID=A0AAV4G616_9GAST|nr:hypothetical protein ElyMa_000569000 [Elysia marginata]